MNSNYDDAVELIGKLTNPIWKDSREYCTMGRRRGANLKTREQHENQVYLSYYHYYDHCYECYCTSIRLIIFCANRNIWYICHVHEMYRRK